MSLAAVDVKPVNNMCWIDRRVAAMPYKACMASKLEVTGELPQASRVEDYLIDELH
jgi:hypothetical protein